MQFVKIAVRELLNQDLVWTAREHFVLIVPNKTLSIGKNSIENTVLTRKK